MKNNISENGALFKVYGNVRDIYQQPISGATVKAYNKTMRDQQLLGNAVTAADGSYTITYTSKNTANAALIISLYDDKNKLVKESEVYYNPDAEIQVDFNLSNKAYTGLPEYDLLLSTVTQFTDNLPLADITETAKQSDISFLVKKTGISKQIIEQLAMAARFEKLMNVSAAAWYGILNKTGISLPASASIITDFETKLNTVLDALMHTPADNLIAGVQEAANANVINPAVNADMEQISRQLSDAIAAYAQQHPISAEPSLLHQKATLSGLKGAELQSFLQLHNSHTGPENELWDNVADHPALKDSKNINKAKVVFKLSQLTENNLSLTEKLIQSNGIKTNTDISKLAGNTAADWDALIKEHKVSLKTDKSKKPVKSARGYGARLEVAFTRAYPTVAFAAKLEKDKDSKLPERDKLTKFLQKNQHFNLLEDRIGQFVKENEGAIAKKDEAIVTGHLRRIQRVMRLAPDYKTSSLLLNDNIHSAQQIFKMGQDNFVDKYGDAIGNKEAKKIFQKAADIHTNAVSFVANMKSMADASAMNVFPNYNQLLIDQLGDELPNLETLFGHTDFCECDECGSVYGAPAYLADILHFLDQRNSTLPKTTGTISPRKPTVKDVILGRRPDLADIDLNCDNTNTEVPYIDIACELMEDYISPPVVLSTKAGLSAKIVKGPINPDVYTEIISLFSNAGHTNVNSALSLQASVSAPYVVNRLQADNTYMAMHYAMIRDSQITLRVASHTGSTALEIKVIHQTLLSADAISATPQYVNVNAYNNFLKTAKKPFALPFDLAETEGRLYLEKLGLKREDLISIFRKQSKEAYGSSAEDFLFADTSLGINETERPLIFNKNPLAQQLYWGNLASQTTIPVLDFEKLSNLNYSQIIDLISLRIFITSASVMIESDNISPDLSKKRLINVNSVWLDLAHRFLRLWRKTSYTMQELSEIIMSPGIGHTNIEHGLSWQLHHFQLIQKEFGLGVMPALVFYANMDEELYNTLFQNKAVMNPLNPDFKYATVYPGNLTMTDERRAVISAILQISADDLDTLILKTDGAFSIHHISFIYRYIQLSQGIGTTITDLLASIDLLGVDPFTEPAATWLFVQKYKVLKSSGFSIDELNYVLFHKDNASQPLIPSATTVSTALTQLQSELIGINNDTQAAVDLNGTLLSKWLSDPSFNWDARQLSRLTDILNTVDNDDYHQKITDNTTFLLNLHVQYHDSVIVTDLPALPDVSGKPGTKIVFPASLSGQISFDTDKKQLRLVGYLSPADYTALKTLSIQTVYRNALAVLYNTAQLTSKDAGNIFFANAAAVNALKNITADKAADRFALFINKIAPVYRKQKQWDLLITDISQWFGLDKNTVIQLLTSVPAIFTDFTSDNFINKIVVANDPAGPYPVQFKRYQFIAKIGFVANKLQLKDTDLVFLLPHAANVGCLNLGNLPLVTPAAPASGTAQVLPSFNDVENLLNLLLFAQTYPTKIIDAASNTTLSVYNILTDAINQPAAPTPAQLKAYIDDLLIKLVTLTDWNKDDLYKLISGPKYLNLTLPADMKSTAVLLQLHKCLTTLKQLGITATNVAEWRKESLTFDDSLKIRQSVKSRYSTTDWLSISKPVQDILREMRRDALITYLLANPGTQTWKTDADLYSYFLIDVEMCSCQPTSRIVEATNAVQLFVQRSFMRLEPLVLVDSKADSNWLQWDWMKNFRVWQANMKVFLYPENYIEPELLPAEIKSSFFADLQSNIMQDSLTAQTAEDAFSTYLLSLDGVSRLEIKGMWHDNASKTLHVIGRTYGGSPRTYYYRKLTEDRRWTPWEKVDVDINSEHIIPVVYNNRIYLFWSVITEYSNPALQVQSNIFGSHSDTSYTLPPPVKQWQVQMGFSEYKKGKWTASKISNADSNGSLLINQLGAPLPELFVFAPIDLPSFDYDNIFDDSGNHKDTEDVYYKKVASSIAENGVLSIFCYYSTLGGDAAGNFITTNTALGGFLLDPVKGYPVVSGAPYDYIMPKRANNDFMFNMLDSELVHGHFHHHVNYITPDESKGSYSNLIAMQLGHYDRYAYLAYIYQQGNLPINNIDQLLSGTYLPFFYQDNLRSYYVENVITDDGNIEINFEQRNEYTRIQLTDGVEAADAYFNELAGKDISNLFLPQIDRYFNFHHPLVQSFLKRLFTGSMDTLMQRDTQFQGDIAYDKTKKFDFATYMGLVPTSLVYSGKNAPVTYPNKVVDANPGYPKDDVDFNLRSGYGLYNWELFFHAPLMVAERLSQNQQFEDADRWYKYIFNPLDTSTETAPGKYWITKPFFLNTDTDYAAQSIGQILSDINSGKKPSLLGDVTDWRKNPFQPHYVAETRIVAYQKVAVMKYIGHLVRYGDYLFTQHTMESVNQATQLYLLASEILGPKPEIVPPSVSTAVNNYSELEGKGLDALSDAMVNVENLMPHQVIKGYGGLTPPQGSPNLQSLYFCIPVNENLVGPTGYWDLVADRLFKIRHCMDIDGNAAPLSLFAPPIDPALLVRATAAGLDLGSILNDINTPLPSYRFAIMIQKAADLSNEVKSLGNTMLSVLEKKDAEALILLRSGHEMKVNNAVLQIKLNQVKDAQSTLDNLLKQKELSTIKQQYYATRLSVGLMSEMEQNAYNMIKDTLKYHEFIPGLNALSAGLTNIPNFTVGVSGLGSPVATTTYGGIALAKAAEVGAIVLGGIANYNEKKASIINTNASYVRRREEWQFQRDLAAKELEQIDKQIIGAEIRLEIANQDVANQQLTIKQSAEVDDFMRSKFANEDLYNWMITQVSNTYFKSYQLAYEVAKQAERCFRYELGLADSAYINLGYWDSLKKGLLAGEQLSYDLKNMEVAYYEQNKRELELTKPVSLSQLDPVALLKLKNTGECWLNLPEELFDMDYPGHYMRRIKSVSLTIPCISGPYTTVSCKLTMTNNAVRTSALSAGDASQYSRKVTNGIPADDPRFRDSIGAMQSIATSSAQNDSGLFELNFRDERYLPFEGAGAISMWHLELPAAVRQFDYNTISDVIINLKYTARDGGDVLKKSAAASLDNKINEMLVSAKDKGLMRIFSAKNDLPSEWYSFTNPASATDDQVLTLNLDKSRFPLFTQSKDKTVKIKSIELIANSNVALVNPVLVTPAPSAPAKLNLAATNTYGTNWLNITMTYNNDPGTWVIKNPAKNARITENMVVIVHYEVHNV